MGIKNSKYIGRVKPPIKPTEKPPKVIDLEQSNEVVNSNERKKYNKTRIAKAYGIKNNILIDDILYTTTFGEGNAHKLSKKTIKDDVEEIDKESEFKLDSNSPKLDVALKRGNSKKVDINNPQYRKKADIININPKINKLIFGDEFKNDNIHIQIAYNILDMNKIISLYYYNIVYAINNLVRDIDISDEDFIGMLSYKNTFEQYNPYINDTGKENYTYEQVKNESVDPRKAKGFYKFDNYARAAYPYFSVFKCYKGKSDSDNEESKKYNFNVLRILSFVRQSVAHSYKTSFNSLYRVNSDSSNSLSKDLIDIINEKFNEDLNKINKNFEENAKVNLWIISKITGMNEDKTLAKDYYNFSMIKENRNIGIKVARVREKLFDYYFKNYNIDMRDEKHDSYRPKINLIYEYIIYKYFENNKNEKEEYVKKLRELAQYKDCEQRKDEIYEEIAKKFAKTNDKYKDIVVKEINEAIKIKKDIKTVNFSTKLTVDKFSLFSKLIYFVSLLLEKKEQNELIASLINKLDDIESFNKIYKDITNDEIKYNLNYSLFNKAGAIASELRIIKNLSHAGAKLEKAGGIIYEDVLRSLGYEGSKVKETISNFEKNKNEHPFRNFIINNIIQSTRYKYVAKYINTKNCQKYIKNENLIKNILNDIPKDQLNKYYKSITKENNIVDKKGDIVERLYKGLKNVNYYYIKSRFESSFSNDCHEDIKSLITLYYTVIYLAVKNLVKINSVFIIGFECIERDYDIIKNFPSNRNDLYDSKTKELYLVRGNSNTDDTNSSVLEFYKAKNKHNYDYLEKNIEEFESIDGIENIFKKIRNNVMHMSIVNKSYKYLEDVKLEINPKSKLGNPVPIYYDLYVYVLEQILLDEYKEIKTKVKEYSKLNVRNHYDKDLLKILLVPFGYNLARYKNLTIRDLFYDEYKYTTEKFEKD